MPRRKEALCFREQGEFVTDAQAPVNGSNKDLWWPSDTRRPKTISESGTPGMGSSLQLFRPRKRVHYELSEVDTSYSPRFYMDLARN